METTRRLLTREDEWMAAPLPDTVPLFSTRGLCGSEREAYRLSAGTAAVRHSYGQDMLLVSDRYRFVCVVIWKVASRTLLKALEGKLSAGGLGAVRVTSSQLTSEQKSEYTTFTFVREPLSRFVSGYFSAMKWVKMKRHAPCVKALVDAHRDSNRGGLEFLTSGDIDKSAETAGHPGEPQRFLSFTKRFFVGPGGAKGGGPGSAVGLGVAFPGVQHVFTQASFLSVTDGDGSPLFPRMDFIGKLETFADDFETLMDLLAARAGVPPPPPYEKIPHRNKSPDGFSALLKGSLVNNTKLLKSVCEFYVQDYACFGYKTVPGCEPPAMQAGSKSKPRGSAWF